MAVQTDLHFSTDLNQGVTVTMLQPVFFTSDEESHRFIIKATRDGKEEKLTGASIKGYVIRPDDATVPLDGSVDTEGRAVLQLSAHCYVVPGRFQVLIRATQGGVVSTLFCGDGGMRRSSSDAIVDTGDVIPSLDELLAQIDKIDAAVEKANNAVGKTPNLTIGTVSTLAPGSQATATITGTAEDPILNLGIPKGVDGDGADGMVQSVNGETGAVRIRKLYSSSDNGYASLSKDDNDCAIFSGYNSENHPKWAIQNDATYPNILQHHYYENGVWKGIGNIYSTVNKPPLDHIGLYGAFGALGNASAFVNDLNNFITQGAVQITGEVANRPEGTSVYGNCWNVYGVAASYLEQRYMDAATLKRYIRYRIDGVWRAWAQEYDGNFKLPVDIVMSTTAVTAAQIGASGYISSQTATAATVSGYTPVAVVSVQSNSSYTLPYAYYLSGTTIGYSVRNLSTQAVTPTLTFHILYKRA